MKNRAAMNSVLVDTNVWVDVALRRRPFEKDAHGVLSTCIRGDVELWFVGTSLKDVFYWVERSAGSEAAYDAVSWMLDMGEVAMVDRPICEEALKLERPDYEDGIIAACAMASRVDAIITRDEAAFAELSIPKYTPTEFLAIMADEDGEGGNSAEVSDGDEGGATGTIGTKHQ